MRIAICDDEQSDLAIIKQYCKQFDPELSVSMFDCGEALLSAFKDDYFDLIFLDIEMGTLNGLDVGKQLVKFQPKPVIVFTTQSLNYAVRGYGIALRYLPKPITYETFCHAMRLALERIAPYRINININNAQNFFPVTDVVYIEVLKHQIVIHLRSGEVLSTRGTLTKIIAQIPNGCFSQPHKSYYINMEYVDKLTRQDVILTNGEIIPIGRSRKEIFQTQLLNYMKGNHLSEYLD